MVMSTKQRYAFICETKTDFVKGDDVPPLLEGLLSDIKAKYPTQINFVEQKKENAKLYRLRDIQPLEHDGEKFFGLLIGLSDEEIPDPVNENRGTGELRTLPRRQDEAPALSAHVLFKCTSDTAKNPTYIERVVGMPSTEIVRYINNILRSNSPGSNCPRLIVDGHPSQTIREALLNNGAIKGVVFVNKKEKSDGIGEPHYPYDEIETIELRPSLSRKEKLTGKAAVDWVRKALTSYGTSDDTKIKIRIMDSDGRNKTTTLHDQPDKFVDDYFIAQELFEDFEIPLQSCYDKLNDEMIQKMMEVVQKLENVDAN